MAAADHPFSYSELLQRLEDLGVAMRTYADSLLDAGNSKGEAVAPAGEKLVKTGD